MRLGLGLAITQPRGRSVSRGAGVPSDASGALGDLYVDTTDSVTYQKRWVANREGAGDSILFPINLFPSMGDFEFSVRVRADNTIDGTLFIADQSPTGWTAAQMLFASGEKNPRLRLGQQDQSPQYEIIGSQSLGTAWQTVRGYRVGNAMTLTIDGVPVGTIADTSLWTPSTTQTGTRALSTANAASLSIKCCDLRLIGPGGSIIAPLNEGTGTVITNQAGANGTLTDGTPANFWYQAWVPLP